MMKSILFLILLSTSVFLSFAQENHPVSWKFSSAQIAPLTYKVKFEATIKAPYHIYPQQSFDGGLGMPTEFIFTEDPNVEFVGQVEEKGLEQKGSDPVAYYAKGVVFSQTVKLKTDKKTSLDFTLKYMACTDAMCLPPLSKKFTVALNTPEEEKGTLAPVESKAQTDYSIQGKVASNNKATIAVLSYTSDKGDLKADTVRIMDGKFGFKGAVSRPYMGELNLLTPRPAGSKGRGYQSNDGGMKNVGLFYLDGNIAVTFDSNGMASVVGGGKEQEAWTAYTKMSIDRQKAYKGDPGAFWEELISDYVKSHADYYVSVDMMEMFTSGAINPKLVEPMYNALSPRLKATEKVTEWKKRLDIAKFEASGQVDAPGFVLNDTQGKAISLASYKGGYVLIDFWASWCVPCRAENPNVRAAYEKYKNKNFQILGVSLDTKKDLWIKAITEDKLPWKQVCDFKAAESEVTKMYHVSSIPANVLVDPNGKIVGKDLRGKALQDRLAELIK